MIEVTQGYNNEFPLTETENKFVYFYSKKSYIVVLNGKPIGFFNMSELKGIGKVNLEYCLLKGYRGQKIGDAFYKLVLEYISKSFTHTSADLCARELYLTPISNDFTTDSVRLPIILTLLAGWSESYSE